MSPNILPKTLIFSLLILSFYFPTVIHGFPSFFKFHVHVVSGLPDNYHALRIHCQSKGDLGYHTLYVNDDFQWKFHVNWQKTTLFFCHLSFLWDIADHHCGSNPNVCYWAVKEYGFYLAEYEHPKPDNLLHTYTWKKK
ncbi:hypothetical protein M9H77_03362 [Catharanthus roseus]|uniref:Uncharacterized protein n=1 Tax=Catharanthus roseus TaxID=4058 RepID=A0ACC0CB76_CATRO|nr:hypothetical protein M9H77_03362 [Catharanthus roseus]